MSDARALARSKALSEINKAYGEGAIMAMSEKPKSGVEALSTGSLTLNNALGIGGYPRGRIIEIFGLEASGKSTMALHAIAECQKAGGSGAYIDAEHAMDPTYAQQLGVNIEDLYLSQPSSGEEGLNIVETLLKSGAFDIIVVDSVAALVPQKELEGEIGAQHVGLQARMMSQAMRKLTAVVAKSNTVLIFINQIRKKIGVMWGSPNTTSGGEALKYYASVRIEVTRLKTLKIGGGEADDEKEAYGNRVRAKAVKNKVSPPFKSGEFDIIFGKGVNHSGELLDLGVEFGIVEKTGAWFSFDDEKIGQGRDKACTYLDDHPELAKKIEKLVQDALGT